VLKDEGPFDAPLFTTAAGSVPLNSRSIIEVITTPLSVGSINCPPVF